MTEYYIDAWGEEQERIDPKDWSRWPLWSAWGERFRWHAGEDFIEQDVVVWREPIIINRYARSPQKRPEWVPAGERLVIAHVRQYSGDPQDWVYLVVVHSEGDEPLARDLKIKRRIKNILRNGVRRWPRGERAAVDLVSDDLRRAPGIPLNARCEDAPPAKSTSIENSRFLNNRKGVPPRSGRPRP